MTMHKAIPLLVTVLLTCMPREARADLDQATLDLSLEPPALNTHPGPEYSAANRPGTMVIGIERTPRGRLWAAWIGNGDSPDGFLMLASSDDGGQT
jgi:hypothetical protein